MILSPRRIVALWRRRKSFAQDPFLQTVNQAIHWLKILERQERTPAQQELLQAVQVRLTRYQEDRLRDPRASNLRRELSKLSSLVEEVLEHLETFDSLSESNFRAVNNVLRTLVGL